jgi:hypothetical protein
MHFLLFKKKLHFFSSKRHILLLKDFFAPVEDGGVVLAAELFPDLGKGFIRHLPAQVHGNLPGKGQNSWSFFYR